MSEKAKVLEGSIEYNHNLDESDQNNDIEVHYGPIEEGKVRYIWISEPGSCKECQKLDGNIYDSANDIPPKPHPNCKCHVEPIKPKTPTTDPIEQRREKALEQERTQLELDKLKGDAEILLEEINESEPQIINIANKIRQIEVNQKDLTDKQKEKLQKAKQDLLQYRSDKNIAQKRLQEIVDIILIPKEESTIAEKIKIFKQTLSETKQWMVDIRNLVLFNMAMWVGSVIFPASAKLWNNAYSGLDNIKEDSSFKVIDTVFDIENEKIRNFIIEKLKSQDMYYSVKGINYTEQSKLSKSLRDSEPIINYIRENKSMFKPNITLPNDSLDFKLLKNFDTYNAFHYTDLINIYIDSDETLHAKIVDTYDFNKKSNGNPFVMFAKHYQDKEWLEGYYSIIDINIPKEIWKKY